MKARRREKRGLENAREKGERKREREREKERRRALNGTSEKKKDEESSAQNIETLYASLLDRRERTHRVVSLGARSFEDFPPAVSPFPSPTRSNQA